MATIYTKVAVLWCWIILITYTATGYSQIPPNTAPNVLWIFSWNKDLPWQRELEKGFSENYQPYTSSSSLYYEYMDAGRFNTPQHKHNFNNYLKTKYAQVPLDYIIFESEPAARFFLRYPDNFKHSRVIILNPEFKLDHHPNVADIISVEVDLPKAVQTVLDLAQGKSIYLIAGNESDSQHRVKLVSQLISQKSSSTQVNVLSGLPLESLLKKVSSLPDNSAIIYLLVFQDNSGAHFTPYYVAQQLSNHANVPIYTFWTSLLGSGVVGGYMLSGEQVGREAANLLLNHYPKGTNNSQSASTDQDKFHGYYFDWQQLQRWNIDPKTLPPDHKILFKKPPPLKVYYREIIAAGALIVLLILWYRNRVLKQYSRNINLAHQKLQQVNHDLLTTQSVMEQQNKKLEALTIRDELTGLYNRAYLDRTLKKEIDRAKRYKTPLSIIMVDVDHFKQVNDNHGHLVGDKVLIKISKVLNCNIRSTDTLARWGGEEFIILCPGLSLSQATTLAEKLRKKIDNATFEDIQHASASFGVASYRDNLTINQMLSEADTALYRSKSNGRNCVSTAA